MKLRLIVILGLSLAFTACNKDDDKDDDKSFASIEGTWKMTAQTLTTSFGGQNETEDIYKDKDACEKDDLTRFNADKTVVHLPGATKCDPSEPASESGGTWSLSADGKKLTVTDGTPEVFDVVALTETSLQLKMTGTDMGVNFTMNATFAKQ